MVGAARECRPTRAARGFALGAVASEDAAAALKRRVALLRRVSLVLMDLRGAVFERLGLSRVALVAKDLRGAVFVGLGPTRLGGFRGTRVAPIEVV